MNLRLLFYSRQPLSQYCLCPAVVPLRLSTPTTANPRMYPEDFYRVINHKPLDFSTRRIMTSVAPNCRWFSRSIGPLQEVTASIANIPQNAGKRNKQNILTDHLFSLWKPFNYGLLSPDQPLPLPAEFATTSHKTALSSREVYDNRHQQRKRASFWQ